MSASIFSVDLELCTKVKFFITSDRLLRVIIASWQVESRKKTGLVNIPRCKRALSTTVRCIWVRKAATVVKELMELTGLIVSRSVAKNSRKTSPEIKFLIKVQGRVAIRSNHWAFIICTF